MELSPNLPAISGSFSNPHMTDAPNTIERTPPGLNGYDESSDTSIFSSSLPVLHHEKLNLADLEGTHQLDKLTRQHSSIDFDKLLPNEEEFFAGIVNDYDLIRQPDQVQDVEDGDIFGNGGGLELDTDSGNRRALELGMDPLENLNSSMQKASIGDGCLGNGSVNYSVINGEHPLGEHPSRTLFVRNINSSVEDSELRTLFEQHGDIHTLYTACKHRGFVMISYYDIRDARNALRALQSKPLRRRKLDIHYSIPKENPSEKDINQGTLVIFNLDPSVTNEYVMQIFGQYGEIKEIRETPNKRHHKFIEFYDVRAAEAALKSLNRAEIAGKRIKLEHSRPGGARRNLVQQSNQYLDHDERAYRKVGSPSLNSPPGSWGQLSSPFSNSPLQAFNQSPKYGVGIPMINMRMQGMDSSLPKPVPNSSYIAAHGNHQSRPRSFPENINFLPGMDSKSGSISSMAAPALMEKRNGAQFHWGSQIPYSDNAQASFWSSSNKPIFGFNSITSPQFNVGSAPPSVHFSHFSEVPQSSFTGHISSGSRHMGMMVNSACHEVAYSNDLKTSGMMSLPRFPYSMSGSLRNSEFENLYEYNQSGLDHINEYQFGNKQYELDLEKIVRGEDARTTLMLKNIPNKYTSKMLLAAIDENHKGTYDFLYLPIDFKNKCNVGYAFINMVSPTHIVPFYQDFNGKKWEKFNSEKVASLAYARIQGKAALITHFQNSSVMNEDKRCRPILFHSEEHGTFGQKVFTANDLSCNQHETYGNPGLEIETTSNQYEKIGDVFTDGTDSVENTFQS